jgi:hypothetical protein
VHYTAGLTLGLLNLDKTKVMKKKSGRHIEYIRNTESRIDTEMRRKCKMIQRGEESTERYRRVEESTGRYREEKKIQEDTERRRRDSKIQRGEESTERYREEKKVQDDTERRRKFRKIQRGEESARRYSKIQRGE